MKKSRLLTVAGLSLAMMQFSMAASAANLSVTNLNDAGAGSLRDAIVTANLNVDASNTISFDPLLTGTLSLASVLPTIGKNLTINAPALSVTIQGSGNQIFLIDSLTDDQTVSISGLNLTGANYSGILFLGAAITVASGDTLNLSDSAIFNNALPPSLNPLNGNGAGLLNNGGTVNIVNSTFSGNTSERSGGAIFQEDGTMTINNSTIMNNHSNMLGIFSFGGGGISVDDGTVTLTNTILAENTNLLNNSPDCDDTVGTGTINSAGNNLIESIVGCSIVLDPTDITAVSPNAGPLQNNGGTTLTRAIGLGSPALNTGDSATCEVEDQRGAPRLTGDAGTHCDIGAFEYQLSGNPTDADVAVSSFSVDPSIAGIGEVLTYTTTVTNKGIGTATNVRLTQAISGPVSGVAETTNFGCTVDASNTVQCDLGDILPGDSVVVSVQATSTDSGMISSSASALGLTTLDPDLTNNGQTADVIVPEEEARAQIRPDVLDYDLELNNTLSQSAEVINVGLATLNIASLEKSGDSNFTIVSENCTGQSLDTGESCNITVQFASGAVDGNFKGLVTLVSNSVEEPSLVLLGSAFDDDQNAVDGGGCSLGNGQSTQASAGFLGFAGVASLAFFFLLRKKDRC